MARTAVAVSPHLDDAVFSCGGLLAALSDSGWRVVVATVFTGSVSAPTGFALACQLDKGLPPDVDYMALRRDEDRAAARVVGAEARWLRFLEAPHRGYHSAAALFGGLHVADDVEGPVARSLGAILDELSPDLVLGPQAIGGHVDHLVTVRALERVERRATAWWQDFPYASRGAAAEPFADAMGRRLEWTSVVDGQRKFRACAAYATQIGYQFGGQRGLERVLDGAGGVERFRLEGEVSLP